MKIKSVAIQMKLNKKRKLITVFEPTNARHPIFANEVVAAIQMMAYFCLIRYSYWHKAFFNSPNQSEWCLLHQCWTHAGCKLL